MITTGASADAISSVWAPLLLDARDEVGDQASLYVYGSVATGMAVPPRSDVDLLTIGLPATAADAISEDLSSRYHDLCRAVTIGPASLADLRADNDAGYGLRVFLRHYCVHLAGDDPAADLPDYPADERAARGFNGDIALHRARWLAELDRGADAKHLGQRMARKSLLAVAGLVSVRDGIWTTDRVAAAARWDELEPDGGVGQLVAWLSDPPDGAHDVRRALRGTIATIERTFAEEIGLWPD